MPGARVPEVKAPEVRAPGLDACDALAEQHAFQAANGSLDFGKLGHRGAIWRRASKPARAARR